MSLASEVLNALAVGRKTRAALLAEVRMSEQVFEQTLTELGNEVFWLGQGENKVLVRRRPVRGTFTSFPLFYIDKQGQDRLAAYLHPLYEGGFLLEMCEVLPWPRDEHGNLCSYGLPYFLYNVVPEGYLGTKFARFVCQNLQVAALPSEWTDDDILHVLSRRGVDLPGNLVLGDIAITRYQKESLERTAWSEAETLLRYAKTASDYQAAEKNNTHLLPPALIGGAQPKFTAYRQLGTEARHVIVKFTSTKGSLANERWADLLVCEHIAMEVAGERLGLSVSKTRLLRDDKFTYLEAERFDRVGRSGRVPVCSWASLNAGLIGTDDAQWPRALKKLYERGLIDSSELVNCLLLWLYGKLIFNTDMHDGNLSLIPLNGKVQLAPLYDMLPMAYAPVNGTLPAKEYVPMPRPSGGVESMWDKAATAALWFWFTVCKDGRISEDFKAIAKQNLGELRRLVELTKNPAT